MLELQDVEMHIAAQGAVQVSYARLLRAGPGIAGILVELQSKYALLLSALGGDGAPSLTLAAGGDTLGLHPTAPRTEPTIVEFPDYADWHVFACEGPGKSTLRLCLVAPAAA